MFHTRWVSSARTSMDASTIQTQAGKAADYGRQPALARYSITKEAPPRDRRSTRSRCVLIRSRGNGASVGAVYDRALFLEMIRKRAVTEGVHTLTDRAYSSDIPSQIPPGAHSVRSTRRWPLFVAPTKLRHRHPNGLSATRSIGAPGRQIRASQQYRV